MKLHESEHIPGFGARMAVPGGWLYDNGCAAFGFVPDPTAEHVKDAERIGRAYPPREEPLPEMDAMRCGRESHNEAVNKCLRLVTHGLNRAGIHGPGAEGMLDELCRLRVDIEEAP